MTCSSAQVLIEAYLDGELGPGQSAEVREHLENCASCTEVYRRLKQLQTDIRAQAPYYQAPDHLRERVRAALHNASERDAVRTRALPWNWMAIAASILLVLSLAWSLALLRSRSSTRDLVAQAILSSHVRSLIGTHLLDVPSSDQHTVKPWFNGKLDFSPNVKDFAAQGFRLLGGRIEYVENRPIAALVYQRRQHVINLFTWPTSSADESGKLELNRNGYHLLHWTKGGMTYWAVSDLNEGELEQFARLYNQ